MELWEDMEQAEVRDEAGEEERVRLPRSRQRRYNTFFTALTMVIAAASCILVVVLLHVQQTGDAASNARDAALQDQLTAIEASLGSIDQSVMDTDAVAAGNAANYAALGSTVDSLRNNLTDYRDNNEIRNEEIGEHLDSVISQLDKIKEDMETAQEESSAQGDDLGTRLDAMTQESAQGSSNLTRELETVHSDIAALIDKADSAQDGNYKELKGILTATDSSLSSLVRDKFDETGSLITSNISSLRGSVDSVGRSVQGVGSDVSAGLADVRGQLESVNTGIAGMQTEVTTANTGVTALGTSLAAVDTRVTHLQTQMGGLSEDVDGLGSDLEDLRHSLLDLYDARSASDETLAGRLDTLQDAVLEDVQAVDTRLQQTQESLSRLDQKIDRILQYHGIADPTDESGGDGGDHSGGTGGAESGDGSSGTDVPEQSGGVGSQDTEEDLSQD